MKRLTNLHSGIRIAKRLSERQRKQRFLSLLYAFQFR